jgi:curli biogenesis system outer membrane secretion channel CsgG
MKPLRTGASGGFPVPVYRVLIFAPAALAALILSACPTTGKAAGTAEEPPALSSPVKAGEPEAGESPAASLAEALYRSYEDLSGMIPGPLSIAVINVASGSPEEGEFAVEELILFLVGSKKYSIVERRSLDIIRAEQNFQRSGEVDDATAVSIGHLTGAAVVITGSISPYGALNYLRLRALDVETGEIRAMSSRPYH